MRRTNATTNQKPEKGTRYSGLSIGVWRVVAVLLLSLTQARGQERPAGVAASGKLPVTSERRIVISIPDRKLALIESGRVVKIYPVAVGAEGNPSPSGEFRIRERITHPTYYAPGTVIGPGKSNPLGTRWIGLSRRGYGIHGTNDSQSIGKSVSHGCIRMKKEDVEELFELVRAGDLVELRAERDSEVAMIFGDAPAVPAAPDILPTKKSQAAFVATVM